eukprot:TRINITY_DN2996_c1_g1_i3.p2 TRINITY_DN2996_c1_g1~~TRINITY_DN2996_c1_g1_i3.p2  ORF type:complete len:136 (+),score=21.14 TRINITY_DN2996_c1_g1_i3:101-508(+)
MRESKKKDEKKQPPPHIHSVWTLVVRLCVESEGFLGGKRKRRRKKKEKKKNVSEGVSIRAVKTKKNDEKKKEEGGRLLVGFNRKKRKKNSADAAYSSGLARLRAVTQPLTPSCAAARATSFTTRGEGMREGKYEE